MANKKKNPRKTNKPIKEINIDGVIFEPVYRVTCPECNTSVTITSEMNAKGEVFCAKCNKTVLYFPPEFFTDLLKGLNK